MTIWMSGADPSRRMGLTMDKNRWTKIDPDYLPEDVRAARDKMLASREAFKQSEALLKAEGLFHRDKSVSKKTAAKLHVRTA